MSELERARRMPARVTRTGNLIAVQSACDHIGLTAPGSESTTYRLRRRGDKIAVDVGTGERLVTIGEYGDEDEGQVAAWEHVTAAREQLVAQWRRQLADDGRLDALARQVDDLEWELLGLPMIHAPRPVGAVEIADMLGVERATVDKWRVRGVLPEPDWTVGGRPAWSETTIEQWARQTGRLPRVVEGVDGTPLR